MILAVRADRPETRRSSLPDPSSWPDSTIDTDKPLVPRRSPLRSACLAPQNEIKISELLSRKPGVQVKGVPEFSDGCRVGGSNKRGIGPRQGEAAARRGPRFGGRI